MNNLATLIEHLRTPEFSKNLEVDYSNPVRTDKQLEALHTARQLSSNEFEVRPDRIKLMAKLLRAGLHFEDNPLEQHEIETFAFWLEDEMDLLNQLDYIQSNANFGIEQHFKHGGKPLPEEGAADE
ncbi:hypothetical protein [Thiomicrorhabdus xiamenensis]|uniref:Uncharacterized protein n=1 Tax=Thiomicrorhabdus xiamenensis TaxID=2739063 RepID=A0A7D4SJF5_9GAMM|nr:hypothetical protein [Thiomicrorhabdus xiamenensis]QKI89919.1 hypothetical protein HQN79_10200 [Thiomicrorhabdus xiamenensis]